MVYNSPNPNKQDKNILIRAARALAQIVARPEKLFLLALILGILAVAGGLWYWQINITQGFLVNEADQSADLDNEQAAVENFKSLLAEQHKDTDNDGLSDFYEINIYKTSPFLPDSDSDGLSDREEVEQGKNPNCPEGKECGFLSPGNDTGQPIVESLPPQPTLNFEAQLGSEMRKLLAANGVDPALLESVSDSELVALYQEVTKGESDSPGEEVSVTDETSAYPADLDGPSLRQLLLQSGAEPDLLNQLTDEQLLDVYQEVLQSGEL